MNKSDSPAIRIFIEFFSFCKARLLNFVFLIYLLFPAALTAQPGPDLSPGALKKLTVEELMNIEVTTVSKSPEKLTETASAIQVITNEDIRRSGVSRLSEALKLVSNLQVARVNAHDWAITSRGFNAVPLSNNTLANKLLVMIDGRTVYEPLFAGVFWDIQNVLLEDVDRVEVVSGPGASLWGANAVNGVINIISRNARETQGVYATGGIGSFMKSTAGLRYGSQIDSVLFFRVYGQWMNSGSTTLTTGIDAMDSWHMGQGGFRMDYQPGSSNTLTLQGDLYDGKENDSLFNYVNGQNVLGRWTHVFSDKSDISFQSYYSRTWRSLPYASFSDKIITWDFDFQHRFQLAKRHTLIWGAGYRLMNDYIDNTPSLSFIPAEKMLQLYSGFVQDKISLIENHLEFTIGTKLLHNDYTNYEFQPSARIAWTPKTKTIFWAAVSRAVRTPARFDVDVQTTYLSTPNGDFNSESVIAYELGVRLHPVDKLALSLATFYNKYDELRTINRNAGPPVAYIFANDQHADTWGIEFSGNYVLNSWWRFRGGYSFLQKEFTYESSNVIANSALIEGLDPKNQVFLQSITDLPKNFQLDFTGRYVDVLPNVGSVPVVPSYITFDLRIAWQYKYLIMSVTGKDLTEKLHQEFGSREVPRSVEGKITIIF